MSDVISRDRATEIVNSNNRETVVYLGPVQPRAIVFPTSLFGNRLLRFQESWYSKYEWVECSTSLDAALLLLPQLRITG